MCTFCESMNREYENDSFLNKNHPDRYVLYSTAIFRRSYNKLFGDIAMSQTTDYGRRDCGYELNYCPECGRRLTKNYAIDSTLEKP